MEAAEEMLLTVTDSGFGKRSSAYEYRVTGRGGQGIANITLAPRNGKAVVATFPVRPGDDVMLVTDAGRLIRVPADQVRITGRQAMGVTLFRVDCGEHVTSVFPVLEEETDENDSPRTGRHRAMLRADDRRRRCRRRRRGPRTRPRCRRPRPTTMAEHTRPRASGCIPARSIPSPTAIST